MATLEDGIYTIINVPNKLATLPSVDPGGIVELLPPSEAEAPGQWWEVKRTPKGTYTIINRGNSLSFEGEPEHGKFVRGVPNRPPREWSLYKAADPFAYHVVVPGGPTADGEELCFDLSPILIFPPRTWLNNLNVEDQRQAWVFRRIN